MYTFVSRRGFQKASICPFGSLTFSDVIFVSLQEWYVASIYTLWIATLLIVVLNTAVIWCIVRERRKSTLYFLLMNMALAGNLLVSCPVIWLAFYSCSATRVTFYSCSVTHEAFYSCPVTRVTFHSCPATRVIFYSCPVTRVALSFLSRITCNVSFLSRIKYVV